MSNKCENCEYSVGDGWCKYPICLKDSDDEKQNEDETDK